MPGSAREALRGGHNLQANVRNGPRATSRCTAFVVTVALPVTAARRPPPVRLLDTVSLHHVHRDRGFGSHRDAQSPGTRAVTAEAAVTTTLAVTTSSDRVSGNDHHTACKLRAVSSNEPPVPSSTLAETIGPAF